MHSKVLCAPRVGLRLALLPCISSTCRSFFATLQFTGYHLLNQRSGQQNSQFASFFKLANLFFVSDFALAFSHTVSVRAQSPLVNAAMGCYLCKGVGLVQTKDMTKRKRIPCGILFFLYSPCWT